MTKFDDWFEANRDRLSDLLRNDQEEALYAAWFAGYEAGLEYMGKYAKVLWKE
mgnify:CR=1 FL=1